MNDAMRDLRNLAVLIQAGMTPEQAEETVQWDYRNGLREQRQLDSILLAWAKAGCVPGLKVRDAKD